MSPEKCFFKKFRQESNSQRPKNESKDLAIAPPKNMYILEAKNFEKLNKTKNIFFKKVPFIY
jgi:hypothetical protein